MVELLLGRTKEKRLQNKMSIFLTLFGKPKYDTVNQQQAIDIVDEYKKTQVLDVRTSEEYRQGSIKGSMNINAQDGAFKQKVDTLDKEGVYLLYCKSGKRSKQACDTMVEMGFKTVFNLKGGLSRWRGEYKVR